jgi:GMP synthase (glutamine-hydrolysing)
MKPFLILQLRPIDAAADNEFEAFLRYGELRHEEVKRVRMEKESIADLDPNDFSGVIVGGGPSNVSDPEDKKSDYQRRFENELYVLFKHIFDNDTPYLGSCYGLGALVKFADGKVSKERYSEEVGYTIIHLNEAGKQDLLLQGLPDSFHAFVGHKEACQFVPDQGRLLGSSEGCPVQIVRFKNNIYATQFHTELDADGIIERIHLYKNFGYFEPERANELIDNVEGIKTVVAQQIFKRFINRYRTKA